MRPTLLPVLGEFVCVTVQKLTDDLVQTRCVLFALLYCFGESNTEAEATAVML